MPYMEQMFSKIEYIMKEESKSMNFRSILEEACNNSDMSKKKIANLAGITTRALAYYLSGDRKPSLEIADRLLKVLGITLVIGDSEFEESG